MNRREAMQAIGAAIVFGIGGQADAKELAARTKFRVYSIQGAKVFNGAIRLEPVGQDWDGTFRPINELSYAPIKPCA